MPATLITADLPIAEANRRLGRGMNFGNCLDAPSEGAWGVALKAEYFAALREAGFASIRLPVRWSAHADAGPPYRIDPAFAARVDWALDQAEKNQLNVVLNIHHFDELFADPRRHEARFLGLWKQLSHRCRDRPASVVFEVLNEPHAQLDAAKWNALLPQALAEIRRHHPRRAVVVGPANWNNLDALPLLKLPADDQHLIATFHCYEPFNFTHQGASWIQGAKAWQGTKWAGTPTEEKFLQTRFAKAGLWGKTNRRPLYLGEFGSFNAADLPARVRWTKFMAREAERQGMSWAYWEFCSGFGAYDPQAERWRDPLLAALIPRAP
jgi:endoglucanase